jgi:hypothetical protein
MPYRFFRHTASLYCAKTYPGAHRFKAEAQALSQAVAFYRQFRILPVNGHPGAAARHPDQLRRADRSAQAGDSVVVS